tara:strand:- start:1007 stop:1480 length:474 start_codon:yes stop_codon:yes gene_type:complete
MSSQVQTQESESTSTESTVQQMLTALVDMAAQQAQQTREMHRNLKKLATEVDKEQKRLAKSSKPRRTVKQKPVGVTKEMEKFLTGHGVEKNEAGYTRQVMMKAVSAYIKDKQLQLQDNRKSWKADKTLAKLFDLDPKSHYTFMNINGLLSRVVPKTD